MMFVLLGVCRMVSCKDYPPSLMWRALERHSFMRPFFFAEGFPHHMKLTRTKVLIAPGCPTTQTILVRVGVSSNKGCADIAYRIGKQ